MRASFSKIRNAFTLMEMLIVLALIVIIAGLSIPVIQSTLLDSRITAAGDLVQGKMADARARAMDEGRPWKLAVLPNTPYYQLAPEDSSEWDNVQADSVEKIGLLRDQLPTEIVFAVSHSDIFDQQQAGGQGSGWQTIGVFLPDGTAREDTTIYFGKPGFGPMRAKLRGLTGQVSVEQFNAGVAE